MLILRIKKTRYTNQSNKNNRIIQLNNIRFSTVVMALVFLSFSAQAQFSAVPADFDRLLVGEMVLSGNSPATSDCGGTVSCSGVLNVRFGSAEINPGSGGSADQLVVRIEARAGQEAIGRLTTPASCRNAAGDDFPDGASGEAFCTSPSQAGANGVYTPESPGTIAIDMPANVMARTGTIFTYNTSLFTESFTSSCTLSAETHTGASIDSIGSLTGFSAGVTGFNYGSELVDQDPSSLNTGQVVVWQHNEYVEQMTVTCDLPDSYNSELLGMAFEVSLYKGNNSHHDFARGRTSYAVSAANSLEFFPLDRSNYITHAEITEGGDGVLIEYAQTVTDPTGAAYAIATTSIDLITPTISDSDIIWLNDRTVWLTLGSSIYDAGVYNGDGTAFNADRHVFVTSTFPGDTSFGNNFAQTSTYRAVLTRHASDADLDQTAPRMTVTTLDYDSIGLTFSRSVCGSPETGCAALTADHFEVVHYEGDVSSAESATLLTISTVTLTGDSTNGYTAVLDIDLDSAPEIDGDDYLLVRTARNSRFTDNFITDRTIFSETQVERTIPFILSTYTEAASGMLHLQSGALVEAIPVITYSLTNNEGSSISEGGIERSTATFIITRAPERVKFESTVGVTITRTSGDGPNNFSVAVGDVPLTRSADGIVWSDVLIFDALEDEKMIFFSFNGNDVGTTDSVYTFELLLPGGARIADGSISIFTIEEDDNTAPVINLADVTINESDVELDDGNRRDFDDLNDYMTRGITQSSLLFSISDSVVTDDPATAATYTRVVVTLIGEGESNTAWTLTNGGDTNFGAPEETTPGKDLIYTYTPVPGRTITDITDVASLIGKIRIVLNASEFPGITDADGTRGIEVELNVFEEQASGTDLIGSGTAEYTLQAENDPVQYIRPVGSPVNIEGSLGGPADGSGSDLVITLVLEETATTSPYTGSLGFFTDGSAAADLLTEGAGGFLTFSPGSSDDSGLLINQTFPTTDSTTIRASELGYNLEVVGGNSGRAARVVSVSDGDGSTESLTFIVEVTEAVLRFRIKVFLEGAQ